MAEDVLEQTAQSEVDTEREVEANAPTVESLQAELAKVKAESRKWEKRAKENKDAAVRIAEIEDAQQVSQSDIAKAKAQAEAAIAELEAMKEAKRREDSIRTVAKAVGVDADLLSMMAGESEEEIKANAEVLQEKLASLRKYPDVNDSGAVDAPRVTKESIAQIKNPNERFEAIKQNVSLFKK